MGMTKTPEQMAVDWYIRLLTEEPAVAIKEAYQVGYQAAKDQLAAADKMMNSSNNSNGWISVRERLPTAADGVTQLWMRGRSLAELVLGCHAVMFEHNEKIEGVLDMNKPDGLWDLSDFTHWMPLPKPPEDN